MLLKRCGKTLMPVVVRLASCASSKGGNSNSKDKCKPEPSCKRSAKRKNCSKVPTPFPSYSECKRRSGKAPFGASSLSFAACTLVPTVPPKLQHTFTAWKGKLSPKPSSPLSNAPSDVHEFPKEQQTPGSISFPYAVAQNGRLRAVSQAQMPEKYISKSRIRKRSKQKTSSQIQGYQQELCFNILSLHTPLPL